MPWSSLKTRWCTTEWLLFFSQNHLLTRVCPGFSRFSEILQNMVRRMSYVFFFLLSSTKGMSTIVWPSPKCERRKRDVFSSSPFFFLSIPKNYLVDVVWPGPKTCWVTHDVFSSVFFSIQTPPSHYRTTNFGNPTVTTLIPSPLLLLLFSPDRDWKSTSKEKDTYRMSTSNPVKKRPCLFP